MPSALISVGELATALASATPPRVIDVRWALTGPPGLDAYRAGHVRGAVFADLDEDLAAPPGAGGRHPLPSPEHLEGALRRLGVCQAGAVIVYDQADATAAARAWWLLRWAGHHDVRVLDGGYAAWHAAGLPEATGEPPAVPLGDVKVRPGAMPVLDAASAGELARAGLLLDVRTPERFRGETEPVDRVAGHVPGARNAPAAGNVAADGRFLSAAQLAERFAALGAGAAAGVGAYCGSGVTAAQTVLALEVAGFPAALYVGSWSEWIGDPRRPVATGG